MNLLRIIAWLSILILVLSIAGSMFKDFNPLPLTNLNFIGSFRPANYTTPRQNVRIYVYSQSFKELYDLGLKTKVEIKNNLLIANSSEDKPFIILGEGNKTFLQTILEMLGADAWRVKPKEYKILVNLANYFNIKNASNAPNSTPTTINVYNRRIRVLPNETAYVLSAFPTNRKDRNVSIIVLKLKKLNTTYRESLPYPPSTNVTLYNYSWIEDYTLAYGWYSKFDFNLTWNSINLQMTPAVILTNGTFKKYLNESAINKHWNLTGRTGKWSYTYEGCYYRGYGPLFHFSFELVKTNTSMYFTDWTFKTRYLYFEKGNYTFYPLLEVYNGKHPIYARVVVNTDGTNFSRTYNLTASPYCYPAYGYCYAYTPFSISVDSAKGDLNATYTVTTYDFVRIGNYTIKRAYESLNLTYSYEVSGSLPKWNDYSFITITQKPVRILLRQSPSWVHDTNVKLNDDYLSKYLIYVEGKWISNAITDFLRKTNLTRTGLADFEAYMLHSQLCLNINPVGENYSKISAEALKSLFEKKGNATAVNYLTPLLFGLSNHIHVDKGILKWYNGKDLESHNGYVLYTSIEKIPDYFSNYSYIGTRSGSKIYLVDLVYQRSPVAIWLTTNQTGYIKPLIQPLHALGEKLEFYKGFRSYPFEYVLNSENLTISEYNMTVLREYLKTARNYDSFKDFI